MESLFVALNITDNGRKRSLLLHLSGEAVFDIFDELIVSPIAEDADPAVDNAYTATKRALDAHFSSKRNVEFEVYSFRLARQNVGESMNTYLAQLRALRKYCEFANIDGELKADIIQTCVSTRLHQLALAEPTMTLQQIVDAARSMETAELQVKVIESGKKEATSSTVTTVRNDRSSGCRRPQQSSTQDTGTSSNTCRNCGRGFPHLGGRESCPAWGKNRRTCSKTGHFAKLCRCGTVNKSPQTQASLGRNQQRPSQQSSRSSNKHDRSVRQVREDASDTACDDGTGSDDYAYTVGSATKTKQPAPTQQDAGNVSCRQRSVNQHHRRKHVRQAQGEANPI